MPMPSIEHFTVVTASASPTFNIRGEAHAQGKVKRRLKINHDDISALWIAIKSITSKKNKKPAKPIVEQKDGKWIWLNNNSLKDRLHLTDEQIYAAMKANRFKELLIKSSTAVSKVINSYRAISHSLNIPKDRELTFISTASEGSVPIFKTSIISVLHFAAAAFEGGKKLVEGEQRFIVRHLPKNALEMHFVERAKVSGEDGSFHKTLCLNTNQKHGYKQTLKKPIDIQDELSALKELNKNGHVWGIQKGPFNPVYGKGQLIGILEPLYLGTYHDLLPCIPTFEDFLFEMDQLLSGLAFIHARGYSHRDLKTTNIWIATAMHDKFFVHIGDFSIAAHASNYFFVHASNSVPEEEYIKTRSLASLSQIIAVEQQIDVLLLGMVLYFRLYKKLPYYVSDKKYLKTEGVKTPEVTRSSPPINALIKKMLSLKPEERPSAKNAHQVLRQYLKASQPKLLDSIQDMIKKGYPG